jgi:hypothetical protein
VGGEIGVITDYGPENRWEIEETPVRLTFEKVESIDALIRSLEEEKELMLKKMYTG